MSAQEERFNTLLAAHHHEIQVYCLRRLPVHDANEAAADVFTVAWRRIADVPNGDDALPWLYGVARNVVRNHRRGSMRRIRLAAKAGSVVDEAAQGAEVQVIRHAEHRELLEALRELREDDQELLRLKAWEELPNRTIGEILDISVQAVESRYARALARLAKHLKPHQRSLRPRPLSQPRREEAL